jgi:beta-lactam-binding protein with PASTA domain
VSGRHTSLRAVAVVVAAFASSTVIAGCGSTHSLPPQTVRMPNLVGLPVVKAVRVIYAAGLCLHDTRSRFQGRPRHVVEQFPRAGASVALRAPVTITNGPTGPSGTVYALAPTAGCEKPLDLPVG